jgi:hypothetical protein
MRVPRSTSSSVWKQSYGAPRVPSADLQTRARRDQEERLHKSMLVWEINMEFRSNAEMWGKIVVYRRHANDALQAVILQNEKNRGPN